MNLQFSRPCLVLVTMSLLIACSGDKTANEYLDSAKLHLESGKLRAALIETRNAVSQAPDNRDARFLLGQLELQLANPADAEVELLRAVEFGLPEPEVAADLSQAYLSLGKLDELKAIDVSLLNDKDKARVQGYQTEAALVQGDLTVASQLAKTALAADPLSPVALTANARLQILEINNSAARTYLSTAIDDAPHYSPAWELLGDIETSEKRLSEALSAYSSAIETGSNMLSPLLKRARTHLALDDVTSAAADVEILEKGNNRNPLVSLLKSEVLLREGKFSDAQITLENGLKNAPDYQPLIRTLAITHMLRGNLGQAEQYAKQYFSATNSDDSRIFLAVVQLQADRLAQAELTLQPLAESGRLTILGAQVLATTFLKQDKIDDAVNTMLSLHENLARAGITESTPLVMQTNPNAFMSAGLLSINADTSSKSDVQPYLSKRDLLLVDAVTALVGQDTAKALESANTLLELQPNNADVHTLIGRIHGATGDSAAASVSLKTAMTLDENPGTAAILAAMLEMNAGAPDSASSTLEDAMSRANGSVRERILLGLATVDASSGNEEQMLKRLKQARSENPASYKPSLSLAAYYASKSEPANVLESLSKVDATGLQNPGVIELRAQAHIALEQFDTAIALITPMVQSEPIAARWRYLRAKANAGKNEIDAVKRDLEVALRVDPDHVPSVLAKANLSILTNDLQQAELQLSRLEALVPGSAALTELSSRVETARQSNAQSQVAPSTDKPPGNTEEVIDLARTLWISGDQDKAVATMSDWLDANPRDITVRLTLANAYMTLNQSADATAAYKAVLQNDADNFIALNNLAWQLRKNDPVAAVSYATRAVAIQPDNVEALDTLAVIQLEQGMVAEAGETFGTIRSFQPKDPTILFHGARIQAALGEKQDAKDILQPLVTGSIDFPDAEAARALYDEL